MLPAERMLDDIMRVLGATVARVATPRDIVNYEAQRTLRERKHEDSRLSTPLPDNHVFGFSQADTSRPSVDPIDTSRLAEDDSNFANLAQSIKKPTLRERYSVAKALIIYWERWDKSEEYTRETDRLKSFFQGLLFETETYTIPAQQSELKLENYVLKQVQEFAQRTRTFQDPSILIIYYVGHGGEDDKKDVTGTGTSQTSRLVWRPFPGSSASVRWYKIQRALDHVMFDVLLLFDSYHLAQVESAREQTVGDSDARMELLAATCNENQTLQRGPGSFTFAIVEIMEDFIRGYNRVEISELHSELLDQKASSYNTPSHVVLRVGPSNRSIILEDLNVLQGYEESNAPPGLGITSEALSSIPESKELGTPTKPTISSDRLLEQYKQYSEYEDPSVIERLKRRVACLADVLESQKHESFHCLQLHGWKHEPHHRRFVFYFQVPIDYGNESKTLYEAITELKGQSRPTLEERLAMAFHIASAVRNWHGVDWVHQSISSHNIIFLKPSSGSSSDRWDFDRPLLQGFGFAQPMAPSTIERWFENIEFDIYQHPDWHRDPKDSPKREHDLYSLGVVLLDIGLWKSCQSVLGKHRKTMNKGEVPKLLIEAARDDLAYCVGSNYRDAVQTCLTSEFSAKHYDGMEIKLLDAVEEMVLQKLRPKPIL
ncbi:uncharacterized protein J4E79_000795 [Alternaria viburni]|uniref:uncharacterized protein n=1 Tax=Alternaria viburni TaxID=566460 RepID=UPI0020C310B5|nr:uncharacterized protein J4E79_000795 [Alternaria viburni]KAI4670513.1 hypothetical protein J4E79_000795 [Alternaria viburni]